MSWHRCIYRGDETRRLKCRVCRQGVRVYECFCESVESDECVVSREGGDRQQAVEASGLPICVECTARIEKPYNKPRSVHDDPLSPEQEQFYKQRALRRAQRAPDRSDVVKRPKKRSVHDG